MNLPFEVALKHVPSKKPEHAVQEDQVHPGVSREYKDYRDYVKLWADNGVPLEESKQIMKTDPIIQTDLEAKL